jgi:hypothetical protein
MNARALLGVLFHADKALDLVACARELGLLPRLDAGPVTLRELADATGARPLRLYKLLDGLESLGLVARDQPSDELGDARYASREPLAGAAEAVLGDGSIERDRNGYPWRGLHGRLPDVLAGRIDSEFAWPPATEAEIRGFERSMAVGTPPIIAALTASGVLADARRWLDVGGGDGTVAAAVLPGLPGLCCDVLNLAAVEPLVRDRAAAAGLTDRLGFVAGDFLAEPLPRGYDVVSLIRVLHDWPADVARGLLRAAAAALEPGARIVICEEFRTPDRLAVQLFWTYFLIGADGCHSRLREAAWYEAALAALGFVDVRVFDGASFDVIVATKG